MPQFERLVSEGQAGGGEENIFLYTANLIWM